MEGHNVRVVHSGDDAIAAYCRESFDVAFMDVMMPGRNGVDSFLEIRRLKPAARVFMMTGYSVEELLMQALDGGALGVLEKPFDAHEVLRLTGSRWPRWRCCGPRHCACFGTGGALVKPSSRRSAGSRAQLSGGAPAGIAAVAGARRHSRD